MSKEMKVGIFFVLGMIILAGLTFYAGGFDDWLKKRYKLLAYFEKVDGLQRDDIVTLAGVEIGEVKGMHVKEDRVEVLLLINGDTVLHKDSVARIESESLLGGKYVSITVGTSAAGRLKDGDTIRSEEAADLAKILQNAADVAQDLRTMVSSFNKNQEKIAAQIQDVLGENRENIRKSFESLARITTENEQSIKETLAALRDAGPKLNETMESVSKITRKIERGEGTIGKLVQDEALYNDIRDLSASLREASGTVTRIMGENEKDIRTVMTSLKDAAPKIEKSMDRIDAITQKIEKGEGTLGKLVQDETLYRETTRMMKEARHAAEDVREQVPIITFTSVIFAAFQ